MQVPVQSEIDRELLTRFRGEIKNKIPHRQGATAEPAIVNPTPLADVTSVLLECARVEYGLEISPADVKVYGKFDSLMFGGSVKVRPAISIVEDAIASGKLRSGQTIFEATSGNFGLALGMLRKLGLEVVALVSRKLQDGVADELRKDGVKLVDLDVDICPAPGLNMEANLVIAKSTAVALRERLAELGFSRVTFDKSRGEIEGLLARQDVIGLAKFLAKVYDGFCPEQYDNELNVASHETVTGPEIDQQLRSSGESLADFRVVCTFGTGGTSTGLSKYIQNRYGRKNVHVIFPLPNQDVGGIRTKDKAAGLKFYAAHSYAGQHEVDFEVARPVLRFFVSRGYNIGESSALALCACVQMLNYGVGTKFVVMLADGVQKYTRGLESRVEGTKRLEVTFQEASSNLSDDEKILWTHTTFVPKDDGVKLIASSLGCDGGRIKVARARDVQELISTQQIPVGMRSLLPKDNSKLLLVCMVGGTSLRVAEILAKTGVEAQSIAGGIMKVGKSNGRSVPDLVQLATE